MCEKTQLPASPDRNAPAIVCSHPGPVMGDEVSGHVLRQNARSGLREVTPTGMSSQHALQRAFRSIAQQVPAELFELQNKRFNTGKEFALQIDAFIAACDDEATV